MGNLSKYKTRIIFTEEALNIYILALETLTVCNHLKRKDLLAKYIKRTIFEELCNPYNIVTCDLKFTEEPNMN